MGRVLLCVGQQAQNPYYFEKIGSNLHSVEELCYAIGESVYFLDDDMIDKKLIKWLEKECGLPALANRLLQLTNQKCSVAAFVGTILDYVGYYPKEKCTQIELILKNASNLPLFERRKAKIDHLVERKLYARAVTEYDELLQEFPHADPEGVALVLHNKAVALAHLFSYEFASYVFLDAYRITGDTEDYLCHLAAMRLYLKEQDYISYMAEHPEDYEMSIALEKRLNQIEEQWKGTEEKAGMDELLFIRENGNKQIYYKEVEKRINGLKQQYRENVAE